MRYLFLLMPVLFFEACLPCECPPTVSIDRPRPYDDKNAKVKPHIIISITKDQKLFIGQNAIDSAMLDSLIKAEVEAKRGLVDTPIVVINADTIAYYGQVFRVMQSAKKVGAKVVANIK